MLSGAAIDCWSADPGHDRLSQCSGLLLVGIGIMTDVGKKKGNHGEGEELEN